MVAIKRTWGKYNGFVKDETVESFVEMWSYENLNAAQYKAMEASALELINAGYLPEKTEYVEVEQ